ncbi:hypothetical protein TWF751_010020 [Orbilia oligospora]|nr:hypothetical protein TWF751_010020 [Orbilia oligospora]
MTSFLMHEEEKKKAETRTSMCARQSRPTSRNRFKISPKMNFGANPTQAPNRFMAEHRFARHKKGTKDALPAAPPMRLVRFDSQSYGWHAPRRLASVHPFMRLWVDDEHGLGRRVLLAQDL